MEGRAIVRRVSFSAFLLIKMNFPFLVLDQCRAFCIESGLRLFFSWGIMLEATDGTETKRDT